MKTLNVPHFSQLDNVYHPEGTCNLTSAAMCLYYHGIRPKKKGVQLEDELFEYVYDNKLSRHSAQDIATVIRAFGCRDKLTWDTTIEEVKQSSTAETLASSTGCSLAPATSLWREATTRRV